LKPVTDYFLKAVEGVQENKQRYLQAEMQAAMKPKGMMPNLAKFMVSHFSSQAETDD
jgi:hypothetical protein